MKIFKDRQKHPKGRRKNSRKLTTKRNKNFHLKICKLFDFLLFYVFCYDINCCSNKLPDGVAWRHEPIR